MADSLSFKSANFAVPPLQDVAEALQNGLRENYKNVSVECVACPDLTTHGAATSGMSGSTALLEFGGEPYAHNPKYRGTAANIEEMVAAIGVDGAKLFGAAMADANAIDNNCGEMIANRELGGANHSCVARVGDNRACIVDPYTVETCGPIANFFICEGQPGQVLCVDVSVRHGDEISLTQSMRQSLSGITEQYGAVGLGGTVELLVGQVKSHVMPNYDCLVDGYYDVQQEQVVKDFLQFYDHMGPGLLMFTALWTGDPTGGELNLRPSGEHTHFYHSDAGAQQGGHYHGDVTPDEVHYRGYFNLAQKIYRFGDIYAALGITP